MTSPLTLGLRSTTILTATASSNQVSRSLQVRTQLCKWMKIVDQPKRLWNHRTNFQVSTPFLKRKMSTNLRKSNYMCQNANKAPRKSLSPYSCKLKSRSSISLHYKPSTSRIIVLTTSMLCRIAKKLTRVRKPLNLKYTLTFNTSQALYIWQAIKEQDETLQRSNYSSSHSIQGSLAIPYALRQELKMIRSSTVLDPATTWMGKKCTMYQRKWWITSRTWSRIT